MIDPDDPVTWDYDVYNKWSRSPIGRAFYIANLVVPTATLSGTAGSGSMITTAPITQKDDDNALVSWNRRPRDVAKYPILKNDADYQDWSLKMKRQLIADTLI